MTRKIPKLKEKREKVVAEEKYSDGSETTVTASDEDAMMLPTQWPTDELPEFPVAFGDATLEKLVRERAFAALEAKLVLAYGAIPDEIKDEIAEMRRSIA